MEPQTHDLLLRQFTAQQCRVLFPKRATVAQQAQTAALLAKLTSTTNTLEQKAQLASEFAARFRECCAQDEKSGSKGRKGLRIDVQLLDTHAGREYWLDATCVHSTCASRLVAELASATARVAPTPLTPHHGAAAGDQTKLKHAVYAPLLSIAAKQQLDGKRPDNPIFLAVTATTHGELGSEAIKTIEIVTKIFRKRVEREGDRADGKKPTDLVNGFRARFRLALLCAVADGHAMMLTTAGLPASSIINSR